MLNLIGVMPERSALLAVPGLHLHEYGKTARPGRKLGHCTLVGASAAERDRLAAKVLQIIDRAGKLSFTDK